MAGSFILNEIREIAAKLRCRQQEEIPLIRLQVHVTENPGNMYTQHIALLLFKFRHVECM